MLASVRPPTLLCAPGQHLYAKLPDLERERIKHAYWQALDEAISEADGKRGSRPMRKALHRDF